jgi:hypothetical protein
VAEGCPLGVCLACSLCIALHYLEGLVFVVLTRRTGFGGEFHGLADVGGGLVDGGLQVICVSALACLGPFPINSRSLALARPHSL